MEEDGETRVVHCTRPHDVYISGPSALAKKNGVVEYPWKNPYWSTFNGGAQNKIPVAQAMRQYEQRIKNTPELWRGLTQLRGKALGCWCYSNDPGCHGNVLVRLVEEKFAALEVERQAIQNRRLGDHACRLLRDKQTPPTDSETTSTEVTGFPALAAVLAMQTKFESLMRWRELEPVAQRLLRGTSGVLLAARAFAATGYGWMIPDWAKQEVQRAEVVLKTGYEGPTASQMEDGDEIVRPRAEAAATHWCDCYALGPVFELPPTTLVFLRGDGDATWNATTGKHGAIFHEMTVAPFQGTSLGDDDDDADHGLQETLARSPSYAIFDSYAREALQAWGDVMGVENAWTRVISGEGYMLCADTDGFDGMQDPVAGGIYRFKVQLTLLRVQAPDALHHLRVLPPSSFLVWKVVECHSVTSETSLSMPFRYLLAMQT